MSDKQELLICEECKNQIVSFHIFRKNARNSQFLIPNLIIQNVVQFIDQNNQEEIVVRESNKCLSLVPKNQLNEFDAVMKLLIPKTSTEIRSPPEEDSWIDDEKEITQTEEDIPVYICKFCSTDDYVTQFCDYSEYEEHIDKYHFPFESVEEVLEDSESTNINEIGEETEIISENEQN